MLSLTLFIPSNPIKNFLEHHIFFLNMLVFVHILFVLASLHYLKMHLTLYYHMYLNILEFEAFSPLNHIFLCIVPSIQR